MGVCLPVYFLKCAITSDTDKMNATLHLIIMVHFVECLHVKAGRLSYHTYIHWSRWVSFIGSPIPPAITDLLGSWYVPGNSVSPRDTAMSKPSVFPEGI